MSRFVDKVATDEITLANGDKAWVRQRLTAEEDAMTQSNLVKIHADMGSGNIEVKEIAWHLQRVHICEAYLTGWDFTDADGKSVPFDVNLIRTLDADTVNEIATAVDLLQKEHREQFQKKAVRS